MAATTYLCFSPSFSLSSLSSHKSQKVTFSILPIQKPQSRIRTRILACEKKGIDLLGDFGARDPFPAEIESNFCENILGNTNTEHKILIPNASALSLSQQDCAPISLDQPPMSDFEARQMLFKVVGWRLANEEGVLRLQCTWKLRDSDCCVELINRINEVVEGTGHSSNLQLEQEANHVRANLWTVSIGGLSLNDFIVAAKIDTVKTSDLVPRKRVWA
nr:probable pterin-4-alpha-carbinolamine dehydratase, chloroplastic [Ipomoea batatas]